MARLINVEYDNQSRIASVTIDDDGDVVECERVRQGHWEDVPDGYFVHDINCSECGRKYNFFAKPNYCPNCGAMMAGGASDE